MEDSEFEGCSADEQGGGIDADSANILIYNTTFSGNSANRGGGIGASESNVNVQESKFKSSYINGNFKTCQSSSSGGGLYTRQSNLTVEKSKFHECSSPDGDGGAVGISGSEFVANSNTFGSCTAAQGGGIFVSKSSLLTAENCHFADSSASKGGAIYVTTSTVAAETCHFADSTASISGGAIYVTSGFISMVDSTATGNQASTEADFMFMVTPSEATIISSDINQSDDSVVSSAVEVNTITSGSG